MTEKNTQLQSENTTISEKLNALESELSAKLKRFEDAANSMKLSSESLTKQLADELAKNTRLNEELQTKKKEIEKLSIKRSDIQHENVTLQRKHQNNVKVSFTEASESTGASDISDSDEETTDGYITDTDGYVTDTTSKNQFIVVQPPAINALKSKDDDVVDWFMELEKVAKAQNWNKATMAKQAPLYFRDEAESVWRRMKPIDRNNYSVLKKFMVRKLKGSSEQEMVNEFNGMRQMVGESPSRLADRMTRLVQRSSKLKKTETRRSMAAAFVKALREDVSSHLINTKFKSIDEALKQAEKLDSLHKKKSREEYRTYFSVNGVSWTQVARIPNNHMAHAANNQYAYGQRQQTDNQRQQQRAQSPRQRRQGYRCLQCNSANHLMRNCQQVDWTALQSVQCGTCGQLGHSSKLCLVSYWRGDEVKGQAPSKETTGTDQKPSPSQ